MGANRSIKRLLQLSMLGALPWTHCVARADVRASDFNKLSSQQRIDFVKQMIEEHSKTLQNLSYLIEERIEDVNPQGVRTAQTISTYDFRKLGISMWLHTVGSKWGAPDEISTEHFITWDGSESRGLVPKEYTGGRSPHGRVEPDERANFAEVYYNTILGLRVSAVDKTFHGNLSEWLGFEIESHCVIEVSPMEADDGLISLTVEEAPKAKFRTFSFDPKRSFSVVKSESVLWNGGSVFSKAISEVIEWSQVSGVWIPKKVKCVTNMVTLNLMQERTIDVKEFSIGTVKQTDLVIDFPLGSLVVDNVKHVSYVIDKPGSFTLKPLADRAETSPRVPEKSSVAQIDENTSKYYRIVPRVLSHAAPASQRHRSALTLVAAGASIILAIFAVFLWVRRSRAKVTRSQ